MRDMHPVAKALVAASAAAASYLIGVMSGDQSFSDVTLVQWLGLVPVIASTFGVTWRVPNKGTAHSDLP